MGSKANIRVLLFYSKAMQVIREALLDPHVRFGRRLALIQRAKRILSSPAFTKGKKKKCEDYEDLELIEPDSSKSVSLSCYFYFVIGFDI